MTNVVLLYVKGHLADPKLSGAFPIFCIQPWFKGNNGTSPLPIAVLPQGLNGRHVAAAIRRRRAELRRVDQVRRRHRAARAHLRQLHRCRPSDLLLRRLLPLRRGRHQQAQRRPADGKCQKSAAIIKSIAPR